MHMLEVRDLKKYYKTKGGVEVHALDGVSIQFPETGMVFLLGKSGSGKSTLLNVSGGLDKPDSGEIIVKGKSSKDFTQSDFDSYRNTFIGFVFQEYNILSEFNVETNIALALELQGKKNDKKAVDDLLKKVDLEGMGKRKPNTLSGVVWLSTRDTILLITVSQNSLVYNLIFHTLQNLIMKLLLVIHRSLKLK